MVLDLARVLNQEARALAEAGAPIVQFDEPAILKHKSDFPLFSEACSILVEGVPSTTALCTFFGDVAGIASEFTSLPFDIIGLDFVVGSANFDLLGAFSQDKALGLGVVDARNTKLESVEEIVAKIGRVTGHVASDRIYVSPNCGLEYLPRRNAHNKLVRMVEAVTAAQEGRS